MGLKHSMRHEEQERKQASYFVAGEGIEPSSPATPRRCLDCTCHLEAAQASGAEGAAFRKQAEPGMAALIANFGGSRWVQAACCELEYMIAAPGKHTKPCTHDE